MIGVESPIREKNLFIGFKAGVSAMDMAYSQTMGNKTNSFVNHSILYHHPHSKQLLSCLAFGITLERTLPRFSYGLEMMVNGVNAQAVDDGTTHRFAEMDSAFFVHARVPIRYYFLKDQSISPYLLVAPSLSTYISDLPIPFSEETLQGYSKWNGYDIRWGTRYASTWHLNVLAGAGMVVKINVGDYQMWARFEAAYNIGLLNTIPRGSTLEENEVKRKMRGGEAMIGLSFPLFKNPSYSWMM